MDEKDSEVVVQYLKRKRLEEYLIENQKYLYRIAFSYVKNTDDVNKIIEKVNQIKGIEKVMRVNNMKDQEL